MINIIDKDVSGRTWIIRQKKPVKNPSWERFQIPTHIADVHAAVPVGRLRKTVKNPSPERFQIPTHIADVHAAVSVETPHGESLLWGTEGCGEVKGRWVMGLLRLKKP